MEEVYIGDFINLSFQVRYPVPLQSVELKIARGNEIFPHICNVQKDIVSALIKGEKVGRHTSWFKCLFEDNSSRSYPIDYLVKEKNKGFNYLETIQNIREVIERNPDKAKDLIDFITSKLQDSKSKDKFIAIWNQEMPKGYRDILEEHLTKLDFNSSASQDSLNNKLENKVGGFSMPKQTTMDDETQQTAPKKIEGDNRIVGGSAQEENKEPYFEKQEKIYLNEGEKSPHGEREQLGPKGGRFYISEESIKETETETLDFKVSSVEELKPTIEKFKKNLSEVLNQLPKEHIKNLEFYLVGSNDLKDSKKGRILGQYEPASDIISISKLSDMLNKKVFDEQYDNNMPGTSKGWKLVVLHELGHKVMEDPRIRKMYLMVINPVGTPGLAQQFYNKSPYGVTKYAHKDYKERFAEAYLYYIQNPTFLEEKDPRMYHFMHNTVFGNKEYIEPLVKQDIKDEKQLPEGSRFMEDGQRLEEILKENQIVKYFNPNLDDEEFYKMIDDILEVKVEPNIQKSHLIPKEQKLPLGSKKLAEQCELEIYKTLRNNIND